MTNQLVKINDSFSERQKLALACVDRALDSNHNGNILRLGMAALKVGSSMSPPIAIDEINSAIIAWFDATRREIPR